MRESFSLGLLLVGGRRNIVVTPARAFKISGLITLVLLCPLPGIIEPGVGEIVRKTSFALSDLVDEGAQVGAAPTAGGCAAAGSAKGHLLAAVALEGYCGRMPLVDSSERHFAALVVCLDALEDLHHRLLPLSPIVCSAGRSCRLFGTLVGWEANPSLVGRQVAIQGLQRDDSRNSRASYILDHDMKNTRVSWALDLGSPLHLPRTRE